MKRIGCILFFTFAALNLGAFGQEPPLPLPNTSPATRPDLNIPEIPIEPPVLPAASPAGGTAAPQLSPAPKTVDLQQLDAAFKATSLGTLAEELRLRLETRKLENRVVNDPPVIAAKNAIKTAHTDLERRRRYHDYYEIYYTRMRAVAPTPEMQAHVDQLKAAHVGLLAQPRVRPTPTPTPTPTPAASPPGKS